MHNLKIKRVYDNPEKQDGVRILVDRLWPRGESKTKAHLDYWYKDIAPSTELRKWFNHEPEKFGEFQKQYIAELKNNAYVQKIKDLLKKNDVTLVYGAKDRQINHAIVLLHFITGD